MGCAKSTEADSPATKAGTNNEKTKSKQDKHVSGGGQQPENKNLLKVEQQDPEVASNGSGKPGWNLHNNENPHLQAPTHSQDIGQSPINIQVSPEQDLIQIKNMANLQSKQVIYSRSPVKMSAIAQNSQENAASNEIKKLQDLNEVAKEQLHNINKTVKQNSNFLQEKLREQDIDVKEVSGFRIDSEKMGEQLYVNPFSLSLPLLEIRPQLKLVS